MGDPGAGYPAGPPLPSTALPVAALHSESRVQFVGDCPLAAPHKYTADGGAGCIAPPAVTPFFAEGARAVAGPALPFSENLRPEELAVAGHCLLPSSLSAADLQRMRQEAAQGDLDWGNIFNDEAPWAGRPEDTPARQVVYSAPDHKLQALEDWGAVLLATVQSSLPGGDRLAVGTLGYVRTALPTRQHLHRDLPLPAAGEQRGLYRCAAEGTAHSPPPWGLQDGNPPYFSFLWWLR